MSLLLSQCCGALPIHPSEIDTGYCSECKDGAAFDNSDKWVAKIKTATDLDGLLVSLKEFQELFGWHEDADDLFDITELPTFGKEIYHTDGIWSWDNTRQISGSCIDDFEIEPREDLEEDQDETAQEKI